MGTQAAIAHRVPQRNRTPPGRDERNWASGMRVCFRDVSLYHLALQQ